MQTGQNSITPESSLPQLEQVRWGCVFMDLTALQPQITPRSTEWCEIDRHGFCKLLSAGPMPNDGYVV
jgi:hypothetical protein